MSDRRRDFLMLVQTRGWLGGEGVDFVIRRLGEAMDFPEEAIPADYRLAADAFWNWKTGGPRPAWVEEYEENLRRGEEEKRSMVRIVLNVDADADEWWMHAERFAEGIPRSCASLVTGRGVESIKVVRSDATRFAEWVGSIPGWSQEPFLFEVEDGAKGDV